MPFWDTDYKKEMMKSKAAKEAAEERAAEAKQRAAEYRQKVNAIIVITSILKIILYTVNLVGKFIYFLLIF